MEIILCKAIKHICSKIEIICEIVLPADQRVNQRIVIWGTIPYGPLTNYSISIVFKLYFEYYSNQPIQEEGIMNMMNE